ncbi:MAG TPA: alpha-L-fucosidase [Tepidisphaeraceae bacterium]|nr:alpha-L-fucosidase [Tepidisphaeraceae bacterium]
MKLSRRKALKMMALAAPAAICLPQAYGQATEPVDPNAAAAGATPAGAPTPAATRPIPPAPQHIPAPAGFGVAQGPFQPTWESLGSQYQVPDWYRDAKFGIWAHWGPQCEPEQGDWYAQRMYQERNAVHKWHVEKYGHPSKFGFKDVINEWKAENWDPVQLLTLYKKAGAQFFAAMANHHDNLDLYDSAYQPWNSVKVGPKKDLVGGWMKATREAGLRFAVTRHGDRAWSWYQDAQPFDGRMTKADGKGLWWDGLDPQDLYAQYHERGRYNWEQTPQQGAPLLDPNFIEKFFNRTIDLLNKYEPDLLYFDDTVLPIYPSSDIGLRIAAYFYNTNLAKKGKLEAVIATKQIKGDQRKAMVLDVERGVTQGGEPLPWQTDTCIGSWHYNRADYDRNRYKSSRQVVQMLIDIVSKNGCLQLSVPVRADGTIDEKEVAIVEGIGQWMAGNSEGIYGTRPWKVYGEGPSVATSQPAGRFGGARDVRSYAPDDFRFTAKGDTVYAYMMGWPEGGKATIKSLAQGSPHFDREVGRIELLGNPGAPLEFTRSPDGLIVSLPEKKPNEIAAALKITPKA